MSVQLNDNSVWRAFEESQLTHSAAHYLMTIMHLRKTNGYARVTDVAEHLKVSRGAASRAIGLFKERGWIEEDPNRMLLLTEAGRNLAANVERNFLLVECFLEDVLGLPKEVAREDACKMEHLLSDRTAEGLHRLIRVFNDNPKTLATIQEKMSKIGELCQPGENCLVCNDVDHCMIAELDNPPEAGRG